MQRLLVASMLSCVMLGCGGGSTTQPAAPSNSTATPANAPGSEAAAYATPEAAYQAFQQAMQDKDWRTTASLLSPESQSTLAGAMIMGSSFVTMGDAAKEKELKELLGKHGVDLDQLAQDEPEPSEAESSPEAMMEALTKTIPDKPAFLAEINAWMDKNADESRGGFVELGTLSEVTVDGDTATARSETEFGQQPIEFRKTAGGWVIHLPVGGPPEGSMGDDLEQDAPDDGSPGLGKFWLGDKSMTLRYAIAYRSKFFDDPCTVVLLTARPVAERQIADLKRMLQDEGNDDAFFVHGTQVKLTLKESGELMSLFAWADNMSINSNSGVELDVHVEGNRLQGTARMTEPDEIADTTYRFDVKFDVELLGISEE